MEKRILKRILALVLSIGLMTAYLPEAQAEELAVTQQPVSVTVAGGETAKVTVRADGEELAYRWYYRNAGSEKFTYTSTFTGNSYAVKMNADRAGRQVYCVITDRNGVSVQTDTVTLNMASALKITKQPENVTVASGEAAKVTVAAQGDGLKYQWYYANKGAEKFAKASITKAAYSVTMTSARAGRRVYCVVTDEYGNKVTSDIVTLNMASVLKITKQPDNVTVASGEAAKVTVAAQGDGLKYQWYYANKGSEKFAKASITKATYSVEMTSARAGRRVYCVVTDEYGNKVTSDIVTLDMAAELKITKQPENVTVASGETAKVTVAAQGDGLKYQWYYANKGSEKFAKASITKATYSVEMTNARAGRRVYCVVTDEYGNKVTSDIVTLDMAAELKITKQPENVTVASGETAKVTVAAQGDGLKYQWYYANKGSEKFAKASITKATYSVEMNETRAGRRVYCVVTDQYGRQIATDTVTLDMEIPEEPAGFLYEIAGGTVTITGYEGTETELTVPMHIDGMTVTAIADGAFSGYELLEKITIPFSVTDIGGNIFDGCAALTTINVYAGSAAEKWCDENGYAANLVDETVPEGLQYSIDGEHAVIVGFSSDASKLVIPARIDGYPVTEISGQAFANKACLEEVILPDTITSMGDFVFNYCTALRNIRIPSGVTAIGVGMFSECSSLTSVVIPDGVTSIGECAFYKCTALTNITIPASVSVMGYSTFSRCSSLVSIRLPEGLSAISDSLFYCCGSLKNVYVPDSVTSIGNTAFVSCENLEFFNMPASLQTIGESAFVGCRKMVGKLIFPAGTTSVGKSAFYNCIGLTGVVFPVGMKSIGEIAFYYCDGLQGELVLPKALTDLGEGAFRGCSGLTGDLVIPAGITDIPDEAFYGCSGLNGTLTLPEGLKSIGSNAIYGTNLGGELKIPSTVTRIDDWAFAWNPFSGTLTLPAGLKHLGSEAFEGTYLSGKVTVPASVTYVGVNPFNTWAGMEVIYECELKPGFVFKKNGADEIELWEYNNQPIHNIQLPTTYEGEPVTTVGFCAFWGCNKITGTLVIPEGYTTLDVQAFSGCTGLTGLPQLPSTLRTIRSRAFESCTGLSGTLILADYVNVMEDDAFVGSNLTVIQNGEIIYQPE